MTISREDMAGIFLLAFLFAMGAWSAINPAGWVRYTFKTRAEIPPNDPNVLFYARFIGILMLLLSAFCIIATLKKS